MNRIITQAILSALGVEGLCLRDPRAPRRLSILFQPKRMQLTIAASVRGQFAATERLMYNGCWSNLARPTEVQF